MSNDIEFITSKLVLETADLPTIKHGGRSSSETLNKVNQAVRADLQAIVSRLDELDDNIALTSQLMVVQSAALQAQASTLATSISGAIAALTDRKQAVVDMYTNTNIAAATDADVNTIYGQATLGIRNSSDKLVSVDVEGNVWIPESSKVTYLYAADIATAPDTRNQFLLSDNYRHALDKRDDTAWALTRTSQVAQAKPYIWVYIQVPIESLTDAYSNTIVIHPFPTFVHDLKGVSCQDYEGTWHDVDLSYQPGYDASTGTVKTFGNARFFFEPTYVAAVRILIAADQSHLTWGFTALELKMTDFMPSSTLRIDLTSQIVAGSSISTVDTLLHGKDPGELSQIPPIISNRTFTYDLTQQLSGVTQVITYMETKWT